MEYKRSKGMSYQDCQEAEQAIEAQQRQMDDRLASTSPDSPWIEHFRQFGQLETLTRDTLVRLVERVAVYEGGRIEIVFRYQSQYKQAMTLAQTISADNTAEVNNYAE